MAENNISLSQIWLLGCLRVHAIRLNWEKWLAEGSDTELEHLLDYQDYLEAVKLVSKSLGIDVKENNVIPQNSRFTDIDYFANNSFLDQKFYDLVQEQYGETVGIHFTLSQMICVTAFLTNFKTRTLRKDGGSSDDGIQPTLEKVHNLLTAIGQFMSVHIDLVRITTDPLFADQYKTLADLMEFPGNDDQRLDILEEASGELIDSMMPHYHWISERLHRARELTNELRSCNPGIDDWQAYEHICTKILRFLFVPPFKKVVEQVSTASNLHRRDAILPSVPQTGLWRLIRDEFDSKHIICEFKNKSNSLSQDDINQLGNYLSKKSIGRFGLLFCRTSDNQSLKLAQRELYMNASALILILDDKIIESMLKARAFVGHAEDVLEDHKTEFEISY